MVGTYTAQSGFRPENESDIMLRLRVLAGEIFSERSYAEFILRQMLPATAVGEYLDAHAAQRGLSRRHATYAQGSVTFSASAEEHEDILIPAGTVVCTTDGMQRFVTDTDTSLNEGVKNVMVSATAEQPGSASNAAVGKIGIIVTPVLGIGAVRNSVRFTGGTDDESDEELRARITDSYRNIINGANAAYYRSVALSVDGVYDASAVGCVRGTGTVDVYVCGRGGGLTGTVLEQVRALMEEAREVNVDVQVQNASAVNVNLYIRLTVEDGYDFETVAAEVQSAVEDYIDSLGIGHDVLLCHVGEVIYHIAGVSDYKFLETYGSDREVPQNRYAKAGTILVRAE